YVLVNILFPDGSDPSSYSGKIIECSYNSRGPNLGMHAGDEEYQRQHNG
ncbi:hypothetical protein LINGRAHAP2_LOCUS13308, partial [Linum grandiflorum]